MSRTARCLFAFGLSVSLAAACGDDDGDDTNTGGTGGGGSGGTAGSAGRGGTAGTGGRAGSAGTGGGGSGGVAGTGGGGSGGTAGTAGTAGTSSTGGDEPDAGPDAAPLVDAGAACPADLDDEVNGPTAGATTSTLSQEVIITRVVFEGDDIRVTFRGASDGPGFNFAEPLVLCTGSEEGDCDGGGVADLEGSGNVDGGTGILLPGEEIDYLFEDGLVGTATTAESGELALVNNLNPNELLSPENAFVRAYVNWGGYISLPPSGEFDGGTAFDDLETRALDGFVWTEGESIEIGSNTTIYATGDVTTAESFSACTAD